MVSGSSFELLSSSICLVPWPGAGLGDTWHSVCAVWVTTSLNTGAGVAGSSVTGGSGVRRENRVASTLIELIEAA